MIIVLLLFFQSICRWCQRIVLHIHDKWINPRNVRLWSEADNEIRIVKRRLRGDKTKITESLNLKNSGHKVIKTKRLPRQRMSNTGTNHNLSVGNPTHIIGSSAILDTECRFCINTPQGYCRHHLHLQELQVRKQQYSSWNPLIVRKNTAQEYRDLRKINRELRQALQYRLNSQHLQTLSNISNKKD